MIKLKNILLEMVFGSFRELFSSAPEALQKRILDLQKIPQHPEYHPEGNVLKHTITVVNRALQQNDMDLAIAALLHDIGKDETLAFKGEKPTAHGHEKVSAKLIKQYRDWIKELGGNPVHIFYIVKNHMRMKKFDVMRPAKQQKLSSYEAFPKLKTFSTIDRGGLDI